MEDSFYSAGKSTIYGGGTPLASKLSGRMTPGSFDDEYDNVSSKGFAGSTPAARRTALNTSVNTGTGISSLNRGRDNAPVGPPMTSLLSSGSSIRKTSKHGNNVSFGDSSVHSFNAVNNSKFDSNQDSDLNETKTPDYELSRSHSRVLSLNSGDGFDVDGKHIF